MVLSIYFCSFEFSTNTHKWTRSVEISGRNWSTRITLALKNLIYAFVTALAAKEEREREVKNRRMRDGIVGIATIDPWNTKERRFWNSRARTGSPGSRYFLVFFSPCRRTSPSRLGYLIHSVPPANRFPGEMKSIYRRYIVGSKTFELA